VHACRYFRAKEGVLEGETAFANLFHNFLDGAFVVVCPANRGLTAAAGDDAYRDTRFKLIPRVVKGSYIVKSAVGQTPAILGSKLVQSYYKGPNYIEVDVDVGSSSVAGGVLKVVKGYSSTLTIDLAFLLEAQAVEELPEALVGAMQFNDLDLGMAVPLEL
jgi:hypothetical protein